MLFSAKSLFTPLVTQIFETLPDKEGANEIRTMFNQFQRMCKHWAGGLEEHAAAVAEGKVITTQFGRGKLVDGAIEASSEDLVMDVPDYDTDSDGDASSVDDFPFPEKDVLNNAEVIEWKANQKKKLAEQKATRKEEKSKRKARDKQAKKAFKGMQEAGLTKGNKVTIPVHKSQTEKT